MNKKKIVFCGSPELAIPTLEALINTENYQVVAVITQADKPAGRGQKLKAPAVKVFAEAHKIRVLQPTTLKKISLENHQLKSSDNKPENIELVEFLNTTPDIEAFIVVAYGKIIPQSLLDFPKSGCINVHMSLLPRLRGAAPIQRAILEGDKESGVSIMQLDSGLDTGPVFAMEGITLSKDETSGSLAEKLSKIGANLLLKTLDNIISGKLPSTQQDANGSSYAEKLSSADFVLNWTNSAEQILRQLRAASPFPGLKTKLNEEQIKIYAAKQALALEHYKNTPGEIVEINKAEIIVATGNNQFICLEEMQFPGKKRLPVVEILKGRTFDKGIRFT